MRILLTNDDGVFADGLWTLAKELKNIAPVTIVAPDREQSAIGAAVTHHCGIRAQKVAPIVPDIEAFAVEGTPGDCVLLGLSKLIKDHVFMVVSGINEGLNVGTDVLISGTVGAALQAYLKGVPSMAISVTTATAPYLEDAARVAAFLADKIASSQLQNNVLFNVNMPNVPVNKIKGAKVTSLATESHIDNVEEGSDGKHKVYWLVRQRSQNKKKHKDIDQNTDVAAIEQGYISITPLHAYINGDHHAAVAADTLSSAIVTEMQKK